MSPPKKIAIVCFCAAVAGFSGYLWLESSYFGFPDGHLTELERWRKPLYQWLAVLNLLWIPPLAKALLTRRRWYLPGYTVFLATFHVINVALSSKLDGGVGG